MTHPDPGGGILTIAILVLVFGAGTIIAVGVTWLQSRPKMKMIEVLKAYAEKGEEPPASIIEAMAKLNWPFPPPPPPRRRTRASHLAHFAGSIVIALGASGIAWWRMTAGDPSSPAPIIAVTVAVFFYAVAAARLVGVLATRDGDR